MTTRWRYSLAALLLAPAAAALAQGAPPKPAGGGLVPATRSGPVLDALGFQWGIDPSSGMISQTTNGCIRGGGMMLQANNNQFSASQPMMTADGKEFVLSGNLAGLEVTRRIRVDVKAGVVRYLDIFKNPSGAPVTLSANLVSNLNYQCQSVLSDAGTPNGGVLGKNESGLVLLNNQGKPAVLFSLAGIRGGLKPSINNNSNYQFEFQYALSVPAGKTVSLLSGVAQRTLTGTPDAKVLADLFKVFKGRGWIRDVPSALRRTIANLDAGGAGGEAPGGAGMPEDLAALRGRSDVLALGENTKLQGAASCAKLSIDTPYGAAVIPFEQAAALVGGKRRGGKTAIYLRDGQILSGGVHAEGLRFKMPSGGVMDLTADGIDRLVTAAPAEETPPDPAFPLLVETFGGDRLAAAADPSLRLSAVTPWGPRPVAPDELRRMTVLEDEQPGHRIELKDGSRFFAFLDDVKISLKTSLFGVREFRPAEIRGILAAGERSPAEKSAGAADPDDIAEPHVVLVGNSILVGRLDLPELHFLAEGEVVPVPPDQLRSLRSQAEGKDAPPGGESPVFEVELWDGGQVTGRLQEAVLPVRAGDVVFRVPARDVVGVSVPSPSVPEALRDRIAGLIRDLGDPAWEKREAASRDLAELGPMARSPLGEALKQATDPEVRKRVQALVEKLDH